MTDATSFRKDHVPELDGLRGIAVLLVLWIHLPRHALGPLVEPWRHAFAPGNVGVDLFFVLSGFLITRILLVDRGRGVPLRYFLARRFLRIFPIYYLTIAVLWGALDWGERLATLSYTSNYAFLFKWKASILEHTWSLAVEEHFYLLWPPVVTFLALRTSERVLWLGVPVLAVASSVAALALLGGVERPDFMRDFLLRTSTVRFFSLGLGALLAFHETRVRASRWRAAGLVALLGLACAGLSQGGLERLGALTALRRTSLPLEDVMHGVRAFAIPFGSLAAVVAGVAWSRSRWPHAWLLRARPLRAIGRISYGLYLYHLPVFMQTGIWGADGPEPRRVALTLAVCFALAALSYALLERPVLALGARFRGRPDTDVGGGAGASSDPARAPWWTLALRALLLAAILGWALGGGARAVVDGVAPLLP